MSDGASENAFAGLKPEGIWKHFDALTRIARPSGREEDAVRYVISWAEDHGFEAVRDQRGNVIVRVPGTSGRESAPVVVIQGHLDMVCERHSNSPYDAAKGEMCVVREGDWLTAVGTTLGADNGLGVAAGMAAAELDEHGPLELLFTLDEETGLTGAQNLDASMITGRIMLNLDSEEDGVLFIGCAGGCDSALVFSGRREAPAPGSTLLEISVRGLKGGHSGLDINRNRLNAIKAMARLVLGGGSATEWALVSIDGGSMRNAIPRESRAVVSVGSGGADAFRTGVESARKALMAEFEKTDGGLEVTVREMGAADADAWTKDDSQRLCHLIQALPSGVQAMSQDIEGLVETSTSLGVVVTDGDQAKLICCSRSSVAAAIRDVLDRIQAIAALAGVSAQETDAYPGWQPKMDSPLLAKARSVSERVFGKPPEVTAIHAGLECGLIGERIPGMDMISFGPEIRGAHSPDERVSIESTARFWRMVEALLDELSR